MPTPLPALIGNATRLPSGAIDRFTLSFLAASGKSYTIESSADAKSWQPLESGIIGNGTTVTRSYSAAGARGFFRLRGE